VLRIETPQAGDQQGLGGVERPFIVAMVEGVFGVRDGLELLEKVSEGLLPPVVVDETR
jgi:hypothetical protein